MAAAACAFEGAVAAERGGVDKADEDTGADADLLDLEDFHSDEESPERNSDQETEDKLKSPEFIFDEETEDEFVMHYELDSHKDELPARRSQGSQVDFPLKSQLRQLKKEIVFADTARRIYLYDKNVGNHSLTVTWRSAKVCFWPKKCSLRPVAPSAAGYLKLIKLKRDPKIGLSQFFP